MAEPPAADALAGVGEAAPPGAQPAGRRPRRTPAPAPVGALIAPIYGLAVRARNASFDAGRRVKRLPVGVVSIGNLSVGGTGKSPMVQHTLRVLRDAGRRPCVAMRGYRAEAGSASDEEAEYARAFPGVRVVAQPDRLAGLLPLFDADDAPDCVVLDDGFQHRFIARDVDIVLIDAMADPFRDRLLPAGWLREPVSSLRRATFAVITHAELADSAQIEHLRERIRRISPDLPLAVARHGWEALSVMSVEEGEARERREPVAWLRGDDGRGRRVLPVCAIGNPLAFLAQTHLATGVEPPESVVLRDHDPYPERTVDAIIEAARRTGVEAIVTTEKDWSKLACVPAERWPCEVVRPRLRLAFDEGEEALRSAILRATDRL